MLLNWPYFPSIPVVWQSTSFASVPCFGFVTEVAFGQNAAVAELINSLLSISFPLMGWNQDAAFWSAVPPVISLSCSLSPGRGALICVALESCIALFLLLLFVLLLFNHRPLHLWFAFHLPLI